MTRNTALRGLVWLIVLFVANGTPIGRVLDNTLDAIAGYHLTEAQHFWWSFVILTALVWYMSNIFVALWGKKEEQQEFSAAQFAPIDGGYVRRFCPRRDRRRNPASGGALMSRP